MPKQMVSRQTMKVPSEAELFLRAVEAPATRRSSKSPRVSASLVVEPPLPDLSIVHPCIPQLGSDPVVEAEIAQAAQHFAAGRQNRVHPLTPEERQRLEIAFNGGIPTDPSQVTDILSLIFRLTSQEDLPERQQKALLDIADRLPALSEAYLVATNIQSAAQQSLDRLNALKPDKNKLIVDYHEQVAVRQSARNGAENCRGRIGEIRGSLKQVRQQYEQLRADHTVIYHGVNQINEKQSLLLQRINSFVLDLDFQDEWELAFSDRKRNDEEMQKATDSWGRFRVSLAGVLSADILRVCLECGYHVLDESTHYSSDLRPTAKQLWKFGIGVLELGILNARGLMPMKNINWRATTVAYCVAKYGQKWVRTRTIIDSIAPRWNEQYTWEVFDPCTVITIGVFDNCHLHGPDKSGGSKDARIGKVRIRLSTLETDRVYTHSYPLLVLHPNGLKKMGEIHLAVRFPSSLLNMMRMYSLPLLPKMHYIRPLTVTQVHSLRYQATQIVSMRLSRAEPPLRKEVVEYMLDMGSHLWSMRRSMANFFRIIGVLSGLIAVGKWFDQICNWKSPITTVLIHILFIILVMYPELILPTVFMYLFLSGIWHYRWRPRHPPHMDTRLCQAVSAHPDELDEEFDTLPTSRPSDIVQMRYDRLRSIAARIQTVVGDLATQGERLQALLSWRDPRATALFVIFCFVVAAILYVTSFQAVALFAGIYVMRHPRFARLN